MKNKPQTPYSLHLVEDITHITEKAEDIIRIQQRYFSKCIDCLNWTEAKEKEYLQMASVWNGRIYEVLKYFKNGTYKIIKN